MTQKEYEMNFRNPFLWVQKADRLWYSSQILYGHLEKFMKSNKDLTIVEDGKFLSLTDSFLLVISLSYENLMKGFIIAKNPDFTERKQYVDDFGFNYNHNLLRMFEKNFRKLDNDENKFIKRLQQYLKWIGKYPLPNEKHIYEESLHYLKSNDNINSKKMYEEIKNLINSTWEETKSRYTLYKQKLK